MATYYEILGVTPTATEEEIKKAFRLKAKQWHPDVNKSPHASDMFRLVYEAYGVLSQKRAEYDSLQYSEEKMPSDEDELASTILNAQQTAQKHASMSYDVFLKTCFDIGKEITIQSAHMTVVVVSLICSTSGIGLLIHGFHWWDVTQIIIGIVLLILSLILFTFKN